MIDRTMVLCFDTAQTRWQKPLTTSFGINDHDPDAMDINRMWKGKGKGKKGNGKDAKGNGKGKDARQREPKGKGKSKSDKGRGKSDAGKQTKPDSNTCSYCYKCGHWKRDCHAWKRDNGSVNRTSNDAAEPQQQTQQFQQPQQPVLQQSHTPSEPSLRTSATSYRTTGTVRQVTGPRVYKIDNDEVPYDLTIFSLREADSDGDECHLRMIHGSAVSDGVDVHAACEEQLDLTCGNSIQQNSNACSTQLFDMTHTDRDGNWHFVGSEDDFPLVRAVNMDEPLEIILDSGAGASCLPLRYGRAGNAVENGNLVYRDASGRPLKTSCTCIAHLQLGSATFTESFLIANVGQPLLALGKLVRSGWNLQSQPDGNAILPDGVHEIEVCHKRNSLCALGYVRAVTQACSSSGNDANEGDALAAAFVPRRTQMPCLMSLGTQCMTRTAIGP